MPEKYRKISKKLIELRETARTLALAGHFDDAQLRKIEADALEAEEIKEAQSKLNKDYRIAKNKLLTKNRMEIGKFHESRTLKRDLLISQLHLLEESGKNRVNVLKSKPTQKKRVGKEATSDSFLITTRGIVSRKAVTHDDKKLPPLLPPNVKQSQSPKPKEKSNEPINQDVPESEVKLDQ